MNLRALIGIFMALLLLDPPARASQPVPLIYHDLTVHLRGHSFGMVEQDRFVLASPVGPRVLAGRETRLVAGPVSFIIPGHLLLWAGAGATMAATAIGYTSTTRRRLNK